MKSKIAIIGAGAVGSTTAYALLLNNLVSQIILVDTDKNRCTGELLDLQDTLAFVHTSSVVMGRYEDARNADIIIITAGHPQKPGKGRQELLHINKTIIASIIQKLEPLDPNTILIVVTNPLDTLVYYTQQLAHLPSNQIIGTGTLLDTQRLRTILSQKISVAEQSVDAYMLGEHGDSQFAAWSTASIAGIPLRAFGIDSLAETDIVNSVRKQADEIIKCKGATRYGIASCVTFICKTILFNQKRVLPLSCYIESLNVCLSLPVVLGRQGIEKILYPSLNQREEKALVKSAHIINNYINKL